MTVQQKKRRLLDCLRQFFRRPAPEAALDKRNILVEPLERRELLAGDAFMALLGSSYSQSSSANESDSVLQAGLAGQTNSQVAASSGTAIASLAGSSSANSTAASSSSSSDTTGLVAEGEPAPDLVAFAEALADSGTLFYGAAWCPFCTEQKELFEDGGKYLPFVEVTNADRTLNQVGIDEAIDEFPTWEFPDGTRLKGLQTLETLSQRAGVSIPQSETPSFDTLDNVNVAIGSPLHIPVDAYDPDGDPLTITVTSSDPNLIGAEVLQNNRSLRLNVGGFGDMVFELFEDRAPRPTGRVIELAQDGFYDGVIFHRVINNFVIQGGDPTGTGSGGSTLGDFDDQYHLELQHNRTGVLSYAKSTDDTNDSQFFITEGPQRFLDFNHSVFGQLVEGESNRDAISNTATDQSDRPTNTVTIQDATIFTDTENGVIMLNPTGNGTGSATITVTVTDSDGNSTSQSFEATVNNDSANGGPFLNDVADVETAENTPVTIPLSSQDKEGDTVSYSVQRVGSQNYGLTVDSATGVVVVTPPTGFSGTLQFVASVSQTSSTTTNSNSDDQLITVTVNAADLTVPTGIDLAAASDTGNSDGDNLTNASTLVFTVTGTNAGSTVEIMLDGDVVGTTVADGTTTDVSVTGISEGVHSFTARQSEGENSSGETSALLVTIDRTAPVPVDTGVIPTTGIVGQAFGVNLDQPEEGQGLGYALTAAPSGLTIGSGTGQINWTPSQSELGTQSIGLTMTDAAGNTRAQDFTVQVIEDPVVRLDLSIVDINGNPLTSVNVGDTFKVQFTAQDIRGFTATGVFSAFADLMFDPNVIQPIANSPIQHIAPFTNGQTGSVGNGVIDELGSFSTQTIGNNGDIEVIAEVTFEAIAAGDAGLMLDAPDATGSDITVFALQAELSLDKVEFRSTEFSVAADFELNDDIFGFDEDPGQQTLDVLDNDVVGAANIQITQVSSPSAGGQVTIASDGQTLLYQPAADFNGSETFTYTVENSVGVSQTATVTIQVTAVNDPPVANADSFSVAAGSTNNTLDVLNNDQTVDSGETLLITGVSAGSAGGSITIGSGGQNLVYTPSSSFSGTETFTYTLSDGSGSTVTGNVAVAVGSDNPPPVVQNDNFTLLEDAAQNTYDVLANDSTSTGGSLTITAVQTSNRGSTFQVSSDGQQVIYAPAPNFTGTEILSYTVTDSNGATAVGLATFSVTGQNDPPIAVDDSITTTSNQTSTTLAVLSNDSDADGDTLTITAVTQPASGSVTISSDSRSILFSPASSDFEGMVSFTYTVSDGNGGSDTATVEVDVRDFIPRDFVGNVYFSSASTTNRFGQIMLTLQGTDLTGRAVQETTLVGADGTYSFDSMAPGNYTIVRSPLPFLNDSGDTIVVNSEFDAGDATNDIQINSSLRPQFFDIRDFLGSSFTNSLTVVVDSSGSTAWSASRGEWADLNTLEIQNTDDNLEVSALNSSDESVQGTIPFANASFAYAAGSFDSFQLLRVPRAPSEVGVNVVTQTAAASASASSGAEGEASADLGDLVAEGESAGVPAEFLSGGTSDESADREPAERDSNDTQSQPGSGSNDAATSSTVSGSSRSRLRASTLRSSSLSSESVDAAMNDLLPSLEVRLDGGLEDSLSNSSTESGARTRLSRRF